MIDTVLNDSPTEAQTARPGKGKKLTLNKYGRQVKNSTLACRKAALRNARPLWDDNQPVSVAPVQAIMRKTDIGMAEKMILIDIITASPDFVHSVGTVQKLLSKTGDKEATEKTAGRYLAKLMCGGFLRRQRIAGPAGGYYRYYVDNLFLEADGKNDQHKRISLTGYSTPDLPGEAGMVVAAPVLETKISRADSQAKMIGQAICQPAGDIANPVNEVHLDARRVAGWKRIMQEGLLFEDTAALRAEQKRRVAAPKASDGPERSKSKPAKAKSKNWMSGKCSESKALAWLEEHPEARAMGDRLLDMTNQPEWTPGLARMLFRRWRNGEITLKQVLQLRHILDPDSTRVNLRWLLVNATQLIEKAMPQLESAHQLLGHRVTRFVRGDGLTWSIELGTARQFLSQLEKSGRLTYDEIFVNSTEFVSRCALVYLLADMGRNDLVLAYHDQRMSTIEDEMAKNFDVWNFYRNLYKAYPDLFFYDQISAEALRDNEKLMLQQECVAHGVTFDYVMNLLVSTAEKDADGSTMHVPVSRQSDEQ
jgi:hypothetical protein